MGFISYLFWLLVALGGLYFFIVSLKDSDSGINDDVKTKILWNFSSIEHINSWETIGSLTTSMVIMLIGAWGIDALEGYGSMLSLLIICYLFYVIRIALANMDLSDLAGSLDVKLKKINKENFQKILPIFSLFWIISIMVSYALPESSNGSSAYESSSDSSSNLTKYEKACKKNIKKCNTNQDVIKIHHGGFYLPTICKAAAEENAKWGDIDWGGWTAANFTNFDGGNSYQKDGTIIFRDYEGKYQNGFGTYTKTTTYCKVDMNKDKVVSVWVN
jgi:hypothetical protein